VAGRVRFGITVTRKVGNAVTRNRIKRTLREGCRRTADLFPPGLDVVIVAHTSASNAASRDALDELTNLARRLGPGSPR
jgi:ribonuclease P protein component